MQTQASQGRRPDREVGHEQGGRDFAERVGLRQPMHTMIYPQTEVALASKLRWVLLFRLVTATVLLGSAVGLQLRSGELSETTSALYVLITGMYAATAACAGVLIRVRMSERQLVALSLSQFAVDTLFVTALIWVTGGAESIFSFLYFLNIISAAYVLFSFGAFTTAGTSAMLYAATLVGTRFGLLPSFRPADPVTAQADFFLYNLFVNVFAFFLVAFLASYLAHQLRRAGDALRVEQGQLRNMEALKNRIVENITSGVLTVDEEGRITSVNRAVLEMTGLREERVSGLPLAEVMPAAAPHLRADAPGDAAPGRILEFPFQRGDGEELILGLRISPLRQDDGVEVGRILIIDDLTHIRAMEERVQREERMAAVGRLAAGIAHEIRNPLASISGSVQILRAGATVSGEEALLMDIAVRETDRLNDLITHFLQYVRPAPPQHTPLSLQSLVMDTVMAAERDPKVHGRITVHTSFNHHLPLWGDPNQLRQVLWNLLLNAADASPDGAQVRISTRDVPGAPPQVELSVADDGVGIHPEVRTRIFDPFFSTKASGTGLGLALVEKIVQSHEGTVRADSRPGEGATFVVTLPSRRPGQGAPWPDGPAPYTSEPAPPRAQEITH